MGINITQIIEEGFVFDDVLLVPKKSSAASRKYIDTSTRIAKKISLKIPIISANMDTVTESKMAIALAREGGMGIIHRFLTIEEQVNEILKVKRSESIIIENPYTISPDRKVNEACEIMATNGVSGLVVVENNKLSGIITRRDVVFNSNKDMLVRDVMTKRDDVITASHDISMENAKNILYENRIEKLPLIDEQDHVVGLITGKDMIKNSEFNSTKDKKGRLVVGAAIGVKPGYVERTEALLRAGADIIVVDIAHGHSDLEINVIKNLRSVYGDNIEIIGGNVATPEGAEDLIKAGADAIKVGVGPGGTCTTRLVTGAGVPQLTAIINCSKITREYQIPLIADGGIKKSGDITKALAAGANAVMIGTEFAGTEEAPGMTLIRNGVKYKMLRGMASLTANVNRQQKENTDMNDFTPEGAETMMIYKGSVVDVIKQFTGGLRSGMSYCGSSNIQELQKDPIFIKITESARIESRPHGVDKS